MISWFNASGNLSAEACKLLVEMAGSGSLEAACVADTLNTTAENYGEQATDEYLIRCAEAIREHAGSFIIEMIIAGRGTPK